MRSSWVQSREQLQRWNTESCQEEGGLGSTGARWDTRLGGREGSDARGMEYLPRTSGKQKVLKQRVKQSKSFAQEAKRRKSSSVSYNLEINHTLGEMFLKEKLFPIIFF